MIHKKLGLFLLLVTVGLLVGCKPNQPPNVQAGSDQTVDAGDKVTLRGNASDSDGTVETYRWEQVDGPSVLLSNADQASASFIALQVVKGSVTLTFRLTVTDDNDATATDDVVVTIAKYGQLGITLSGTVKNHLTYKGIPSGTITVRQYHGNLSQMVGAAKTSRDGKYTVQVRVNPGRLTVTANAAGFAPQSIIVDVSDGSRRTADLAMIPVQVTQPFRLENNASIKVDGQTVVSLSANKNVFEERITNRHTQIDTLALKGIQRDIMDLIKGEGRIMDSLKASEARLDSKIKILQGGVKVLQDSAVAFSDHLDRHYFLQRDNLNK